MSERDLSRETLVSSPCVLHGSFRRNFDAIHSAAITLESTGYVDVVEPKDFDVVGEREGFALLSGQEHIDPREVEAEFLRSVLSLKASGGFSYWINPDGYIGKSAAFEYGLARACGTRTYFTDQPQDVPFYVPHSAIIKPEQFAGYLVEHRGKLPEIDPEEEAIGRVWHRSLLLPVAHVAVGGVVSHRGRVLLVEDGRWEGHRLTVPGTTVLVGETREEALLRLEDKFGIRIRDIMPLLTSFMLEGSGFRRPVVDMVFDDRQISVASERLRLQAGLIGHWLSVAEASDLITADDVEPNAGRLLKQFLKVA